MLVPGSLQAGCCFGVKTVIAKGSKIGSIGVSNLVLGIDLQEKC